MIETLFLLLFVHAVSDYPLQGDFLARAKNRHAPIPGVPWLHGLFWHSLIHGGGVALVTGSVSLGLAEVVVHMAIDDAKCTGRFGEGERAFHVDQSLHVLCKLAWVLIAHV